MADASRTGSGDVLVHDQAGSLAVVWLPSPEEGVAGGVWVELSEEHLS